MDPRKLPFNALIVGPTNSGKTQYLINQLRGPFRGVFDYIVLFCPTFVNNKTYDHFVDKNPCIFVVVCIQHEIEGWLKLASYFFEKTNTLFVLDDCAASKYVKGRTSQLVNLNHPGRTWQQSYLFTLLQAKQRRPSSKTMQVRLRMMSTKSLLHG